METPRFTVETQSCPRCGSTVTADARRCYLCDRDFSQAALEARIVPATVDAPTFSLSSLFLFTTLCAAWAAALALSAPLGVALILFSVPALFRTQRVVGRWWHRTGKPISAVDIAIEFVGSLILLVMASVLSIGAAFTVLMIFAAAGSMIIGIAGTIGGEQAQTALFMLAGHLFLVAVLGSLITGILSGYLLLREFWPKNGLRAVRESAIPPAEMGAILSHGTPTVEPSPYPGPFSEGERG